MRLSTLSFLVLPPLVWASNAIVGRLAVGAMPPITLNFLRWVVALLVFLPFVIGRVRRDWPLAKKHWRLWMCTPYCIGHITLCRISSRRAVSRQVLCTDFARCSSSWSRR